MNEVSRCGYSSIFIMPEHILPVHLFVGVSRLDGVQDDVFQQEDQMEYLKPTNENEDKGRRVVDMMLRYRNLHTLQISNTLSFMIIEKLDRLCFVRERLVQMKAMQN